MSTLHSDMYERVPSTCDDLMNSLQEGLFKMMAWAFTRMQPECQRLDPPQRFPLPAMIYCIPGKPL